MAISIKSTQVNPFHNTIDLIVKNSKNLFQKANAELLNAKQCGGNFKRIFKIIENNTSKREDFG